MLEFVPESILNSKAYKKELARTGDKTEAAIFALKIESSRLEAQSQFLYTLAMSLEDEQLELSA